MTSKKSVKVAPKLKILTPLQLMTVFEPGVLLGCQKQPVCHLCHNWPNKVISKPLKKNWFFFCGICSHKTVGLIVHHCIDAICTNSSSNKGYNEWGQLVFWSVHQNAFQIISDWPERGSKIILLHLPTRPKTTQTRVCLLGSSMLIYLQHAGLQHPAFQP